MLGGKAVVNEAQTEQVETEAIENEAPLETEGDESLIVEKT